MGEFTALKQACSTEDHRAQGAFKDSMIHGILQFTLPIAFRCVLHRWENQEIRCRKLCIVCWPVTVQPSSTFILTIRVCSEERPQERPQKTSLKPFSKTVHTGLWMYSGCRRPGTLCGVRMACPEKITAWPPPPKQRGGCKVSQGAHAFRASLWAKR